LIPQDANSAEYSGRETVKKLLVSIIAAVAVLAIQPSGAQAQQGKLQDILESGKLRFGLPGSFNPFTFRDADSLENIGYDFDLVNALAEDLGVELEIVETSYQALVSGIAADLYDITATASLQVGRATVAAYTQPYFAVATVPLTLDSNFSRFPSWDSINQSGVTVATTLGTVFDEQADSFFPNAERVRVENPAREFQEVLAGRADVFITSNVEASTLTVEFPNLRVIPVEPRRQRPLGMIAAQGDMDFINFLNTWIELRKASGFFDELAAKWNLAN
jgi:cyclohexadienyl dehydratase